MFDSHEFIEPEATASETLAAPRARAEPVDPGGHALEAVAAVIDVLGELVASCRADDLLAPDAVRLVEQLTQAERLVGVVRSRAAAKVAETPALWRARGDRSAGHWLARILGSSVADAVAVLETEGHLPHQPAVADAFEKGRLSARQAALVSGTVAAVAEQPGATDAAAVAAELLEQASTASMAELRDHCIAVRMANLADPDARHRDIHRRRSLRFRTSTDGAAELLARGTADDMAVIAAAIAGRRRTVFDRARHEGRHERSDAHDFDALVALARDDGETDDAPPTDAEEVVGQTSPTPTRRRRRRGPKVMIRIDEDALHHHDAPTSPPPSEPSASHNPTSSPAPPGAQPAPPRPPGGAPAPTRHPTTAEVVGQGTIPAGRVVELIAEHDAEVHAVVARGRCNDTVVIGVANLGRARADGSHPALAGPTALHEATRAKLVDVTESHDRRPTNAAQATALDFRDPRCCVEGCEQRQRLETDHRTGWARTRTTGIADLDRLCAMHHKLKTVFGYRLAPGSGKRPLLPP